jgi:hypothetical protein
LNRDPIGERGGENLYQALRSDGVNQIDILGLSDAPVTIEGFIGAFGYYLGGNLGYSNITLSDKLIEQVGESYLTSKVPDIKKLLLQSAKCGEIRKMGRKLTRDDSFAFPGWNASIGQFQVTGVLKCSISCAPCTSREGICGCVCRANCGMSIFISKTYTFERSRFNTANDSWDVEVLRQWNRVNQNWPWSNGGTQYFITAEGFQTISLKFMLLCN